MEKRKDSKNRVLKTGEYQRKDRYEYKWQDSLGRRHSVYGKTLDELREKERLIIKDVLDGVRHDIVTVEELYERWKRIKYGSIRDITLQHYIYSYEHYIAPLLGKRKAGDLKKSDIKVFYSYLHNQANLSCSTISGCHNVLTQVLNLAVDDGLIRTNPCAGAFKDFKKATDLENSKRNALTVEQQKLLETYLRTSPRVEQWYPLIIVLLYSGLRIAECAGLRWCDIDIEARTIDINHVLTYYCYDRGDGINAATSRSSGKCGYRINPPKTDAGKRVIPMCSKVVEAFQMEKKRQEELGIRCEFTVDSMTDFIFLNQYGYPLRSKSVNKILRQVIKDCNRWAEANWQEGEPPTRLPHFSCHILRHTFVTRACEAGLNLKALTAIVGHETLSMTLNVYADCSYEFKKSEIMKLESCNSFGLGEDPNDGLYDNCTTKVQESMINYGNMAGTFVQ